MGSLNQEDDIESFLITNYLDEITVQEIVLESSINPETNTEFDNKIVWDTSEYRN